MAYLSMHSGRTPSEIIGELENGEELYLRRDSHTFVIKSYDASLYIGYCIDPNLRFAESVPYGLRWLTKDEVLALIGTSEVNETI
ncbi:hypothetical protein JIR001_05870 [Polycladomyces abyssicola]|uniref:Uncharacterized protein n=1 Tax=Polycladomyces abyssicola TaxID=1125966 RepID=A0A8D5ZJS6_9BACL|nr:hypothetical protein JIR001_05870 [Polycladomyces abyssicola]